MFRKGAVSTFQLRASRRVPLELEMRSRFRQGYRTGDVRTRLLINYMEKGNHLRRRFRWPCLCIQESRSWRKGSTADIRLLSALPESLKLDLFRAYLHGSLAKCYTIFNINTGAVSLPL
jgi:hypothetical protein